MMPGLRSPVVRSWLLSRVLVLVALLAAVLIPGHRNASLLSWDAKWYDSIAVHGYAGSDAGGIRFFPALPLFARWSGALLAVPPGVVLIVLASGAALLYLVLARRLALEVGLSPATADRVPAVVAFAPAGFVLVMGYTEALFGVLLCLVLLGARRGNWLLVAAAALVAGALRPTGVLLGLPIVIEACRGLRSVTPAGLAARLTAVAAPVVGLGLYLAWAWRAYGDPLAPFRAQTVPGLRGGVLVDPVSTLVDGVRALLDDNSSAVVIHLVWIVASIALLVVSARRLPPSFTAFAAATLFLAVTARNFSYFERYACSALPLLLAAAVVFEDRRRWRRFAGIVAPLVLFGYAVVAFVGGYVP
jgi:hypothetical protein